jgi:hypothetical protein
MKKRLISLLLVLSMCFGLMTSTYAANISNFSDLKAGAWYMEYVPYMIEQGYMDGTGYGRFEPNATLTRATFVTILGRIAGVKESTYNTASKFSDVAKGQWYAPYVNWAVKKGITDGTGTSTFSPNQAITREQMATMIYRYVNAYGLEPRASDAAVATFTDSSKVSSYAAKAVELMRKTGIMVGDDDRRFSPKSYATRAEAATVCYRLIAAMEDENWAEAYAKLLEGNSGWYGIKLAYLDGDDIPELIVLLSAYNGNSPNHIGLYCYQNGKAVQLVEEFEECRTFWYLPKCNLMYVWWGHGSTTGENRYTIGTIQNGSYVVLDQIDHQYVEALNTDKNDYYHWEKAITEDEFSALKAKYQIADYGEEDEYISPEFVKIDRYTSNRMRNNPTYFLGSGK